MNERQIVRAVADNFCYEGVERPEGLPEPWATVWARTEKALEATESRIEAVRWACQDLENRGTVQGAIIRALPVEMEFENLEQLARRLKPITWLWPGWIPRGMLTLLGASTGAGKSLVALDLARRIIHGLEWPDGQRIETGEGDAGGRACIYVDAEAMPQIQSERAKAWGMDQKQLYVMLPREAYGSVNLGEQACQDRLVAMCSALEPELVVVDSLSTISGRGENSVEDVRALLGFLSNTAREFSCGMLLIHHLRKRGAVDLRDDVGPDDFRGSGHILAIARSVMALSVVRTGERLDRNGPRRLEVVKTNLARYPEALGVTLTPIPSAPGQGWLTPPPMPEYGEAPRPHREPTQVDACAEWLVEAMREAGEPMRPKDVIAMAEEAGFSEGLVFRARKLLEGQVVDTKGRKAPGNRWGLAEEGG